MIGFNWMGHFSRITLETKFYFISPALKSNVNRIFLWWVEISFRVSCKHPLRLTFSTGKYFQYFKSEKDPKQLLGVAKLHICGKRNKELLARFC